MVFRGPFYLVPPLILKYQKCNFYRPRAKYPHPSCLGGEYPAGTGWGNPPTWGCVGVTVGEQLGLDRLCLGRYAFCVFSQEDLLVALSL